MRGTALAFLTNPHASLRSWPPEAVGQEVRTREESHRHGWRRQPYYMRPAWLVPRLGRRQSKEAADPMGHPDRSRTPVRIVTRDPGDASYARRPGVLRSLGLGMITWSGAQTVARGLTNNGGFEPPLAANMRGLNPTLAANKLRFIATSSQTVMRAHIRCTQSLEGLPVRNKSGSPLI
jgi:hypothetical protein